MIHHLSPGLSWVLDWQVAAGAQGGSIVGDEAGGADHSRELCAFCGYPFSVVY